MLAALLAAPIRAQATEADGPNPFDLSPEQLFGATVTSVSKTPQRLFDAPAAISVLTNEDIKRSGATSIPEVLRLVPGVNVAQVNTHSWAISIRGFNNGLANKLLVLIDGREVYDHLFSGVYWDVQDTPLEDVERIEVIRGPGATLWGANAVNGVINIITKDSFDTQGGLVSATAGNLERNTTVGRYGGKIGDNGTYRVYGKYLNRGPEDNVLGADAHDGWIAYRGGFRSDFHLHDGTDKLTVQGDLYHSDADQFHVVPNTVAFPFFTIDPEQVQARGGNVLARWERTFSDASQLQLQAYFDYTFRDQLTLKDRRVSTDFDAQYTFPAMGRHQMIGGARYRFSRSDLTPTALITTAIPVRNEDLVSAFLQDKITLQQDKWYLTLGSKIEHNDYSGIEIQPNARLQWHPTPSQMLWTSVARAVRTPSRLEHDTQIFSGVVLPFGPLIPIVVQLDPSPRFDSEVLMAYEAGYRNQLTPDLTLDLAAFYNDYNNLSTLTLQAPIFAPPPITLPILFTNDTTAKVYGLETSVDWQARDNLKLTVAHTLLQMHLDGPPPAVAINSEAAETQSPASQLAIHGAWDITPAVTFDPILYHTSPLQNFRVDDYWRMDARLAWKPRDGLELSLIGQNLFSDNHREFSSPGDTVSPTINRSIFGNVTWRF